MDISLIVALICLKTGMYIAEICLKGSGKMLIRDWSLITGMRGGATKWAGGGHM